MNQTRRTFIKSAAITALGVDLLKPATLLAQSSDSAADGTENSPATPSAPLSKKPGAKPWQPGKGILMTRWSEQVTPDKVWPEYPRPQMTRERWRNLNGLWNYQITGKGEVHLPTQFAGEILIPFGIESPLSGVMQPLLPDQRLWYERGFTVPADWAGQRVLLHFGAVDWDATISLDGRKLGTHRGG